MSTLPLYWKLSSHAQDERISATVDLIASIERFQMDHTSARDGEGATDEDARTGGWGDRTDVATSEDVKYALRRLTRGLASPNESSRVGFAVALTEVSLMQVPAIVSNSSHLASSWNVYPQ